MAMMEWSNALKVGHSAIDRDHQRLVALINELSEAMEAGRGKDVCGGVLEELISYTKSHFAMEEQLMSVHQYPATAEHREEHARLIQDVVKFQDEFKADTSILSVSLLHFLMKWLTSHILVSDKALASAVSKS